MFWSKKKTDEVEINWTRLSDLSQLDEIIEESKEKPVMIYKHSTRCGISGMALNRLERSWDATGEAVKPYYLDLLSFREISDEVAERFQVYHQSPQVIVVKNGKAVYDDSHMGISFEVLIAAAQ